MNTPRRRKSDFIEPPVIDKWWHWIRPYWHVASFIVIITFIGATKWSNIQAYADTLANHEKRISNLEISQSIAAADMATVRQEVHDIHERIIGNDAHH